MFNIVFMWIGGVGELIIVLSVFCLGLPLIYGACIVRAKCCGSTDAEVTNAASIQLAVDGGGAPSTASMSRGDECRPGEIYFDVPFEDKHRANTAKARAKALGARFDSEVKAWYAPSTTIAKLLHRNGFQRKIIQGINIYYTVN